MFRTPVDGFFPDFLRAQNMVRAIEGKIRERGNENWFELAGVRLIVEFELLQRMNDRNGSTKTWNPESGNGNGVTETETEYGIRNP